MPARATTRRRHLGATLRKLRARKGMTLEEAGQLVGVSKATVSRYETTEGPVKWLVVDALCREYGASGPERTAIVALAKDAKQQGWWSSFADHIPETMNLMLTLEDEAVREDHFSCVYVPGLLQTRRYTTALQQANEMRRSPEEIERLVDIRMRRQEILARPKAPHLWAILDESVIRRVMGSPRSCMSNSAICSPSAGQETSHFRSSPSPLAHTAQPSAVSSSSAAQSPPLMWCTSTFTSAPSSWRRRRN